MMHLFTEIVEKFDALKADLTGAVSKATTAVADGISFTEAEIKAAEVEVFSKLEVTEMTISKAFAAGAQWAAGRVATATAAPVVAGNGDGSATSAAAS
jgi:hypothetical protein